MGGKGMERVACETSSQQVFFLLHDATAIVSISSREWVFWVLGRGQRVGVA